MSTKNTNVPQGGAAIESARYMYMLNAAEISTAAAV